MIHLLGAIDALFAVPKFCKYYYDYWDSFINEWRCFACPSYKIPLGKRSWNIAQEKLYPNITKWKYPSFLNAIQGKETVEYLPEPWWGNDGTHPLSAVVINLNPGEGGDSQLRTNLPRFSRYSRYVSHKVNDFVNNKEFKIYLNNKRVKSTTEWLLLQRALPIFNAFPGIPFQSVENVLAVELFPWHSKAYKDTCNYHINNCSEIFKYSIMFALEASEHVCYPELRNIVFARVRIQLLWNILKNISGINIQSINYKFKMLGKEEIFIINYNGKCYYIIANNNSFNNLPSKGTMRNIVINQIP